MSRYKSKYYEETGSLVSDLSIENRKLKDKVKHLETENNRYREALEYIACGKHHNYGFPEIGSNKAQAIAEQALKGDK